MTEFIEYISENLFAPAVALFQMLPQELSSLLTAVVSVCTLVFAFKIIRRTLQ